MFDLFYETLNYVINTLVHNAPSLILGILAASAIKVYVDPEALKNALMRSSAVSIPASVAFGAFTPFCACGTMAIIVSMLTTALPWGPIMAFIVSSPLMSPDSFIILSGVISPRFAVVLTAASIILGLAAGYITHMIEMNSHFLDDQARFQDNRAKSNCGCSSPLVMESTAACSCSGTQTVCCSREASATSAFAALSEKFKLKELLSVIIDVGLKKVLLYFSIFAAIGYFINRFVPAELIFRFFNPDNIFAVPLSALVGLPLYVSGSSSLPIIKVLLENGAGEGAMLAFMITGPATSAGAIAGIATIMRKRALALYITYILAGGIILGYLYNLLLAFLI